MIKRSINSPQSSQPVPLPAGYVGEVLTSSLTNYREFQGIFLTLYDLLSYCTEPHNIEDINEENPLGMKGEIARAFGELMKNLWSGCYTYVVPRNFKMAAPSLLD